MHIDNDARIYLTWAAVTNVDPTDATLVMRVGDTLHPLTWTSDATLTAGSWTRSAQSDVMFTGSAVTPSGADVALDPGRYRCEAILTLADGQIVPARPFVLTVA